MKGQRGFTLIEVIVVASIIAILAGILVPMIFNQIDEARIARAQADSKSISTAILMFRKDTGRWPLFSAADCTIIYDTLEGTGTPPPNALGDWKIGTNNSAIASVLNLAANAACYNNSKALTYLPQEPAADPWNYRYVVNVANFAGPNPVWVISAGPDGKIDTPVNSQTLTGDDIGVRIK